MRTITVDVPYLPKITEEDKTIMDLLLVSTALSQTAMENEFKKKEQKKEKSSKQKPRKKHDLDWYISHNRVKGLAIGDKICYYHTRRTGELQSRTKRDENMYEEWRTLKTEWREVRQEEGYEHTDYEKWKDKEKAERLIELEELMKHRKDLIECKKITKKPKQTKKEEKEDKNVVYVLRPPLYGGDEEEECIACYTDKNDEDIFYV